MATTKTTATKNLPNFLSDSQLAAAFNVHRATIWRWTAAGILPRPIKLSTGCTRWKLSDIEQLQEGAL